MAGATSGKTIHAYSKRAKDKVRKSGDSAKRKAVQLGQEARVFSAVLHFNPTYRRLDGAVHVPEGQSIPDVNGFLADLLSRSRDPQRAPMRHQPVQDRPGGSAALHDEITAETGNIEIDANAEGTVDADADISHNIAADRNSADWIGNPRAGHDDTPTATTDPDDETQRHRGMGNDLAFFGASRDAENQEMPDGAVADVRTSLRWRRLETKRRPDDPKTSLIGKWWMHEMRMSRLHKWLVLAPPEPKRVQRNGFGGKWLCACGLQHDGNGYRYSS
ncbi:patatin-like serine hydrolase [Colletotrichum tabaci]|uniref:Patatin-like serine hydrolase n=1 Tax=Colletotrichum tabaci TaxID=1209068 RepID=A0AAV9TJE7_9PEZI